MAEMDRHLQEPNQDRGSYTQLDDHASYPDVSSTPVKENVLVQPIGDWDSTTMPLEELREIDIRMLH